MKPLPCPFCAGLLENRRVGDTWAHPNETGCVLDGFGISGAAKIAAWNRRSPPLRTLEEWDEEIGDVVWWFFNEEGVPEEAPWIGTPLDQGQTVELHAGQGPHKPTLLYRGHVGGWPGYHTHWSPLPPHASVRGPVATGAEEGEG